MNTFREKAKKFALKHDRILTIWRKTFGKLKTSVYFNHQKKELQKNGMGLISKINRALDKYNAKYFVDCGTLLGMVRDKKPIPYDRDIDYGIWFDDVFTPDKLDKVMKGIGLKRISRGRVDGEIQEVTYASGSIHIDFFRHSEVGNESRIYVFYRDVEVTYPSKNHYSILMQRRLHITGLKKIEIAGVGMNIPENTEPYLASIYTNNWRIPDPKWLFTMEPGCEFIKDKFGIRE